MKKLTTVETFRPSCSAIVAWISLLGRLISLKIATNVRLCISVKTIRGFFVSDCPSDRLESRLRLLVFAKLTNTEIFK